MATRKTTKTNEVSKKEETAMATKSNATSEKEKVSATTVEKTTAKKTNKPVSKTKENQNKVEGLKRRIFKDNKKSPYSLSAPERMVETIFFLNLKIWDIIRYIKLNQNKYSVNGAITGVPFDEICLRFVKHESGLNALRNILSFLTDITSTINSYPDDNNILICNEDPVSKTGYRTRYRINDCINTMLYNDGQINPIFMDSLGFSFDFDVHREHLCNSSKNINFSCLLDDDFDDFIKRLTVLDNHLKTMNGDEMAAFFSVVDKTYGLFMRFMYGNSNFANVLPLLILSESFLFCNNNSLQQDEGHKDYEYTITTIDNSMHDLYHSLIAQGIEHSAEDANEFSVNINHFYFNFTDDIGLDVQNGTLYPVNLNPVGDYLFGMNPNVGPYDDDDNNTTNGTIQYSKDHIFRKFIYCCLNSLCATGLFTIPNDSIPSYHDLYHSLDKYCKNIETNTTLLSLSLPATHLLTLTNMGKYLKNIYQIVKGYYDDAVYESFLARCNKRMMFECARNKISSSVAKAMQLTTIAFPRFDWSNNINARAINNFSNTGVIMSDIFATLNGVKDSGCDDNGFKPSIACKLLLQVIGIYADLLNEQDQPFKPIVYNKHMGFINACLRLLFVMFTNTSNIYNRWYLQSKDISKSDYVEQGRHYSIESNKHNASMFMDIIKVFETLYYVELSSISTDNAVNELITHICTSITEDPYQFCDKSDAIESKVIQFIYSFSDYDGSFDVIPNLDVIGDRPKDIKKIIKKIQTCDLLVNFPERPIYFRG